MEKWGKLIIIGETSYSVVANVLNCNIVVSELELQSRSYIHFRT